MRLKISARSSHLARLQAYMVGDFLKTQNSHLQIEYFFRESLGDKNLTDPLWKMPEKGVFTEDFYMDLVEGKTDLVVHSWKDLPIGEKAGTEIIATLPRADQRDLLLIKRKHRNEKKLRLFTSSPRREYNLAPFLRDALPAQPENIEFLSVRGNVPTRLNKLMADESVHGLVLAKAAVDRFLSSGWEGVQDVQREIRRHLRECDWMVLPLSQNPNAAAQGALAIEISRDRDDLRNLLSGVNDSASFSAAVMEREILSQYGGGCHQKIGVAILPRSYGTVQFLRGLTDQGQILDSKVVLRKPAALDQLRSLKKWASSQMRDGFHREETPFVFPENIQGIFVSRISAWRPYPGLVWAAGEITWKKLASMGVWVHGCAEGLGENEDPRVDDLFGGPVRWAKLTHAVALDSKYSKLVNLTTYKLKWIPGFENQFKDNLLRSDICYWTSPTHFELITQIFPEVRSKKHASGPGLTSRYLRDQIKTEPFVFLNESEFFAVSDPV